MALSGSTTVKVTAYDSLVFSWSASQNIPGNYSTVSWSLVLKSTAYGKIISSASKSWSVVVNGSKYSGKNSVAIGNSTSKTLASGSTRVAHNSNGTKTFSYSFSQQFDINFNGWVGTKSGSGSGTLNTIDRTAPTASLSYLSSTYNTITVRTDSNAPINYCALDINDTGWQYYDPNTALSNNTGVMDKTITGCRPNTKYKIELALRKKSNNVWGYSSAINVTTPKPPLPTAGTITVASKGYDTITLTLSGFAVHSASTVARYEYKIGDGSWTSNGTSTTISLTELLPNTDYDISVRIVDNYSQASPAKDITVKTEKPPVPIIGGVTIQTIDYDAVTFTVEGHAAVTTKPVQFVQQLAYAIYPSNTIPADIPWVTKDIPGSLAAATETFTASDLEPGTAYILRARVTDNYGQSAEYSQEVTFTTLDPESPSAGIISVEEVTINSITYKLVGYSAAQGVELARIEYNFNGQGWVSLGLTDTIKIENLTPATAYTMQFKIVDEFDQEALTDTITTNTLEDKFVYIIDGTTETKHEMHLVYEENGEVVDLKITKDKIALVYNLYLIDADGKFIEDTAAALLLANEERKGIV